jgi:hypothetical protein
MEQTQQDKITDQVRRAFNNLAMIGTPPQQIKTEVYGIAEALVQTQLQDWKTNQSPNHAEVKRLTAIIYENALQQSDVKDI